ncbi:MAG: hypothetical protein WD155_00300 [Burkholderiales bacterium]
MADPERDVRVSERYRALGREQPPPELDAAILAASRRRRSRWVVPVSIAAVVVLAVGVTLRVQLEERKDAEDIVLSPRVMQAPESRAQAAPEAAAPVGRARAGAAAGKNSAPPETPELWLERIARLRDAGKARAADESLAEFKRRYPDYRISEALRARIAPR